MEQLTLTVGEFLDVRLDGLYDVGDVDESGFRQASISWFKATCTRESCSWTGTTIDGLGPKGELSEFALKHVVTAHPEELMLEERETEE